MGRTIFAALLLLVQALTTAGKEQKLRPEELVARHLASLGPAGTRTSIVNRIMQGQATVNFTLGGAGQLGGNGVLISQGPMSRIAMTFSHQEYPGENLAFDGESVTVGVLRPGRRSDLAQFVNDYDFLLKEGLVGGATTTAWCLLGLEERRPKLDYRGMKKIEGRDLHELRYSPRKWVGEFRIHLYFEPDTCRHVLTQYSLKIPPYMAFPEHLRDSYWRMQEEFGDFRTVDGLQLPHSYHLRLTFEGATQTRISEWKLSFNEVRHNVPIDRAVFQIR